MARSMTPAEFLDQFPDLTEDRLARLTDEGIIRPAHSDTGPRFSEIDAARLQLVLDLEDAFALHDDAMGLVLSLIDQLNGAKGDMRAMLRAVAAEPPETRARLRGVIRQAIITVRR